MITNLNRLARDLDHVLTHTADLWDQLHDAQIFVTGGTGFFGCWLLESFAWAHQHLKLDATLTVLTRSPEVFRAKAPHLAKYPAIRLTTGDVRSFEFPSGRFTHVIHAATEASAAMIRERPLEMLDTIVTGTRRALDFAVATGAQRFLLASSGAVYGPQPAELIHMPESYGGGPDPGDPRSVYGEGKRLAEQLCAIYDHQYAVECVIARGFAFVGPYLPLDIHFAIGNFIRDCLDSRTVGIRGDGTPHRSYLYGADLAIWLWTILVRGQAMRPNQAMRPYNVGAERDVTIAELGNIVATTLGNPAGMRVSETARPDRPVERYVPDTFRARQELGLQEWIPLEEGIRRTAEWYSAK